MFLVLEWNILKYKSDNFTQIDIITIITKIMIPVHQFSHLVEIH